MIICEDGFVWKLISREQAEQIIKNEIFEVYAVDDNEQDYLIDSIDKLERVGSHALAIEVGFINK